jgi:hypothetical protein
MSRGTVKVDLSEFKEFGLPCFGSAPIDLIETKGPQKGQTWKGLCSRCGSFAVVCVSLKGRPEGFRGSENLPVIVFRYERQSDELRDRAKKQLQSDNYTVTYGATPVFDADATLEIGDGSGHGFTLGWMRFKPTQGGVEVLTIDLAEGRMPYKSKWPPDLAPITIKCAKMKPDAYAGLLRDLATVDSAKLQRNPAALSGSSSRNFWVQARLTAKDKNLMDMNWAGYDGFPAELQFAKPNAAVTVAREAVERLDFKEHSLTQEERAWASAKFVGHWKKFKGMDSYWWVNERSIIVIGVAGDKTALPTLREILGGSPKDLCVYYGINAVTRITNKDVRDRPLEEMDVEKTRRKVLELLRDVK